jgi:large conductance mechanosensitive channel
MNIVKEFLEFIKKQGVLGLAVGFIFGTESSKLVSSIVNDIANPILGVVLGFNGKLSDKYTLLWGAKVMWGDLLTEVVNFLIIAFLVYFVVEKFGLSKNEKKE